MKKNITLRNAEVTITEEAENYHLIIDIPDEAMLNMRTIGDDKKKC